MECDPFLDELHIIERFDLLKMFGDYYWHMQYKYNEYWAIPNLGQKISLKVFEFSHKQSLSFKQQMTSFPSSDDFALIYQYHETSILPDMESKRFFNSFLAKIDEIEENGTVDVEKMKKVCSIYKKILTSKKNYNQCVELLQSLINTDKTIKEAKHTKTISLTDPTLLSIFLYLGYRSFIEGMEMDTGPNGHPSANKRLRPKKPEIWFGQVAPMKMEMD